MDLVTKPKQKLFVKAFFSLWVDMHDLSSLEHTILMYLMDNMDIANEVIFGKVEMEELAKRINSSRRSIDVTFKKLLKRSPTLILHTRYYSYIVCPDLGIKNKDFDKIQYLFEAYQNEDGEAIMKCKASIMSKGNVEILRESIKPIQDMDMSKFI